MSAREVRRQTCNESRPWSDRLLIKPSERAEPASPPAIAGHINCKASADRTSTGLRSRVTQESRPQPRRHQLCQPAPGQPARALQVTQTEDSRAFLLALALALAKNEGSTLARQQAIPPMLGQPCTNSNGALAPPEGRLLRPFGAGARWALAMLRWLRRSMVVRPECSRSAAFWRVPVVR